MIDMRIDNRLLAVMIAVFALTVCAVCVTDGSDAASSKTVSVYAEVDGRVVEMTGAGADPSSAIKDAVSKAGYGVELGPVNMISFNGQTAPSGQYWTVQQWLPPRGWQVITFGSDANAHFEAGTSYFLYLADRTVDGGFSSYTSPDFEPQDRAYFYIQFKEDVNANSYVTDVLTEEQRSEGFWISGTGSNAAWAFKDACERFGFELNMSNGIKGDIVDFDFIGWLNSFLGLTDVLISGTTNDGSWKYWSQFYWDGSGWVYGETLGHYDPSVVSYFALVRQITTKDNVSTALDQDPSDAPISKIDGSCRVTFRDGNGNVIKTQNVPYFGSATAPSDPTKNPADGVTYTFTGWDRGFDQVISDITVTAQFKASGSPTVPPETPVTPSDPGTTTVPVKGVTITGGQKVLEVGGTCTLSATVSPSNATNRAVTWTSGNPDVATVDPAGKVTAVGSGTAVITATTSDGGKTASVTVTVAGPIKSISLSSSFLAMGKGDSATLIATVGGGSAVKWTSSDPKVVTVDGNGEVTAVSDSGSAVITADAGDGLIAKCRVTVISEETIDEITDIELDGNDDDVYEVEFTENHLKALVDNGKDYTVSTVIGSVTLSVDILANMDGAEGNLTVSVASLNTSQKDIVGDITAYEYRLNDGNTTKLGGTATITMPFVLKAGEDPEKVRVYHIDSRGGLEEFRCTYSDGSVTFETTHFSVYFATTEDLLSRQDGGSADDGSDDSGSDTMLYVGIAVAVIAVIAVAAVFVMRRNA